MIRRAWHVLTDPPTSRLAFVAMIAISLQVALIGMAVVVGADGGLIVARVVALTAFVTVLGVVRQRDRARAEVARLVRAGGGP